MEALLVGRRRTGIVAGALLAGVLLGACGSDGGSTSETAATASPDSQASDSADAGADVGAGADGEVVMRLIAYRPAELRVAAGREVTWRQEDAGFHTVTSGTAEKSSSGGVETKPDGKFESGQIAQGKTFSFTFDEAGAYPYFCEIHPATMSGRVVVE